MFEVEPGDIAVFADTMTEGMVGLCGWDELELEMFSFVDQGTQVALNIYFEVTLPSSVRLDICGGFSGRLKQGENTPQLDQWPPNPQSRVLSRCQLVQDIALSNSQIHHQNSQQMARQERMTMVVKR